MNTIHLKYFVEIAELKSINKAAKKLFINRSSLSAAIDSLENELGFKLLNRGIQGVSLTVDGIIVYHDAKNILQMIESWQDRKKENRMTIKLCSLPALSETLALDILSHLTVKFKQCDFFSKCLTNDISAIFEQAMDNDMSHSIVLGGYYDMQKEEFSYLAQTNYCHIIPLFTTKHLLYYNHAKKSQLQAHPNLSYLSEQGFKLITFPEGMPSILYKTTSKNQQVVQVMSLHQAFNMIASNPLAVGIFPSFLKDDYRFRYETLSYIELEEIDITMNYCLIVQENLLSNAVIKAIIKEITNYF